MFIDLIKSNKKVFHVFNFLRFYVEVQSIIVKSMMRSKYFYLCFSCCIFMVMFLIFKLKQPNINVGIHLKSNPKPYKGPQKQDWRQWMKEKEKNYQNDKERIQKTCKRYNVKKSKSLDKQFMYVDRNHRIAVCSHDKVGSSTWRYHLINFLPTNIYGKLAKQYKINAQDMPMKWLAALHSYYEIPQNTVSGGSTNRISPSSINNYLSSNQILSFSFVRHPFERLVSAYNDKFIKEWSKYGKIYSGWFEKGRSFSSFVNLVLYQYRKSCYPKSTNTSRIRTNWSNENCEAKINNHWRPFAFRCHYCDINYDVIGRMETWNDDLNYIIRKRGLEQVLPLQKANTSHLHASRHNTTEMTKEYSNTLSQKQKDDLYHMFRLDFEMFNYDPKIYL